MYDYSEIRPKSDINKCDFLEARVKRIAID